MLVACQSPQLLFCVVFISGIISAVASLLPVFAGMGHRSSTQVSFMELSNYVHNPNPAGPLILSLSLSVPLSLTLSLFVFILYQSI